MSRLDMSRHAHGHYTSSLRVNENRVIFLKKRTALGKQVNASDDGFAMRYLHGPERQAAGWQALHGLCLQNGILQAHEGRDDRRGGAATWS